MSLFFIFAGPNGSGKSTSISQTLEAYPDCIYLNADYCARTNPEISAMPDGVDKSLRAQKETERQLALHLSKGDCVAWETVFSHPSRLHLMDEARAQGYHIRLTYVTTKHPDINVSRVHHRAAEGGHDVPEEKVRSRYSRSVGYLPEMLMRADEALVYDNSYDGWAPLLIFTKSTDAEYLIINWNQMDGEVQEWVVENISHPLSGRGIPVGKLC